MDAIPVVNTWLVATCGVIIVLAWLIIRRDRRANLRLHKRLMLTATTIFVVFLALYVARIVAEGPTNFRDANPAAPDWAAPFYYAFLGTHMLLALVTVALIPIVIRRGLRGDYARHRALARKVAPMWLISIAMGITVYFMLFQIWR